MKKEKTHVQIDLKDRDRLREFSKKNYMTMTGFIKFLLDEYEKKNV